MAIASGYSSGIKLPEQDNYEIAYKEAAHDLAISDIHKISEESGARLIINDSIECLALSFIDKEIVIEYPEIKVYYQNKNDEVPLWLKIIILQYLTYAKGTPSSGNQITYKQISGGLSYYPIFQKRAIIPILEAFGGNFQNFVSCGKKIGGIKAFKGDYSLTFHVLPRVSITYVIWDGDGEFPPAGNVIFDSSIEDYLTTEDIVVLCNMISVMIIKNKNF